MVQTLIFSAVSAEVVEETNSHNILFLLYFIMNLIDLLTGVCKATYLHEYDSNKMCKGVIKKIARWLLVIIAIVVYEMFIELGDAVNIDLQMTKTLVWFVLSALTFQDIRSAFENLIVLGVEIPPTLLKALALAESKFGDNDPARTSGAFDGDMVVDTSNPDKDVYRLELDIPVEEISEKETIVLKVKRADKQKINPT